MDIQEKANEKDRQTESQDAIRLLSRRTDDMRRDPENELYIVNEKGLWVRADEGEQPTRSLLYDMVQQEREREGKATSKDDKHAGFNHWNRVVKLAMLHFASNAGGVAIVNTSDFDNYEQHRVLPFNDGSAWDFTQHRMLSREELKAALLLDHGWSIPATPPVPTDADGNVIIELNEDLKTLLFEHYGEPLMEMFAARLREGPSKLVDSWRAATSGFGKSTFMDAMDRAFPGAIHREPTPKYMSSGGARFSQDTEPLSMTIWTAVDEVDKAEKPIAFDKFGTYANETLSIERKFANPRKVRRTSRLVLMGADWANTNTSIQGVATRLQRAVEHTSEDEMSSDDRALMLENAHVLRRYIVSLANRPMNKDIETTLENTAAEFRRLRADQLRVWLAESLQRKKGAEITTAALTEAIKEAIDDGDLPLDKAPDPKAISAAMKAVWNKAPERVGNNNNRRRAYTGLTMVEDADLE